MKSSIGQPFWILAWATYVLAGQTGGLNAQSDERDVSPSVEAWRLDRIGQGGDTATYRIWRENLTVGRDGTVLSTIRASGMLTRTLTEEVASGVWRERVRWREYEYGEGAPGTAGTDLQPIVGAVGVTYEIDPREDPLSWLDAPVTDMTPGPASMLFTVLILDAWSWDGLIDELRRAGHHAVRPGETIALDAWDEARDTGSRTSGLSGRYRLGATEVTVVGLAACGDSRECLRLSFRVGPNEVIQEMPGIRISGQEFITGTADLSLDDGSLVRGELWGPLIATFQANGAALPVSGVLQRVTTTRIR